MKKKKTCTVCAPLIPHSFRSSEDFMNCLKIFEDLLTSGSSETLSSNFELGHLKDRNGFWIDDGLHYEIACKVCGRVYQCHCDTYHGCGGLELVKVREKDSFQ